MNQFTLCGMTSWEGERDDEGHRTFILKTKWEADDSANGPRGLMNVVDATIPIGSAWNFGNDMDWAYCYPDLKVKQIGPDEERKVMWIAEQKFSTRPLFRCQSASIESPLLEPVKYGGSFVKEKRQAFFNKDGEPLHTSSLEPIPGAERDFSQPAVWVEFNHLTNLLATFAPMIDTLNDATMWNLPARCIKLNNVTWERKWYAVCTVYFTSRFEFGVNAIDDPENPGTTISGYDEIRPDIGTRVLDVGGDPTKQMEFVKYKDAHGENDTVYLDGAGEAVDDIDDVAKITCEYYGESNFLSITGIPSSL